MDTNRVALASTFQGTTNADFLAIAASPVWADINITGESLQHQKETIQSAIIRPDRNVLDLVRVGDMANGDFSFELIAGGAFDFLYRAALMNAPVVISETVAVTFASAGQTMTIDAGTWAVTPIAGQYLRITNAVDAGNNGVKRVVSATTTVVTFEAGSLTADESADSVTIKGSAYRNGVTPQYYGLERRATNGVDTMYQAYTGCLLDEFGLDLVSKQITKGTAKWMGKAGDSSDAILAGATYTTANTNKPINATTHVGSLKRGGSALTDFLKTLSINVKNNCRYKDAIANMGPFDMGLGKCEITGKMQAYFENKTLLDAFLAHTYASLSVVQTDANNNSICAYVPSAVFGTAGPKTPGENQDLMQDLDWQAVYDSTVGGSLVVTVITP